MPSLRTNLLPVLCTTCIAFISAAVVAIGQDPSQLTRYTVSPAKITPWVIAHEPLTDEDITRVNLELFAEGNKDAAWELGLAYMQGAGVPVDLTKAEQMFQIGAVTAEEKSMVGMFHAHGYFPKDIDAVERWYVAAGRPEDYFELAESFKAAGESDKSAAGKYYPNATAIYLKLLKDPSQPQARRAQLELGNFVIDGIYSADNDAKSRALALAWARMIAQELLGQKEYQDAVEYDIGKEDLPADKTMWLRLCKRALAYNIDNAQHFYVEALNEGVARDFTGYDAVAWTRLNSQKMFADRGLLQAMTSLMIPQQKAEAEAAYLDLIKTRELYGAYYVQDDPLRNPTAAQLAAMDQDDPDVQLRVAFNMEKLAATDDAVYKKVLSIYRTVRDHRNYDSRFVLGRYALYGRNGVPKNRAAAEYWLNEAAQSGSQPARELLKQIRDGSSLN